MGRVFFLIAAWSLLAAGQVAGQVVYLEGEINGGQQGFELTPLPAIPYESLPAPYRGVFTYERASSRATFELTIDVGGFPSADLFASNFFQGVVQNDPAQLIADLISPPEPWITSFQLMLDKSTGQGEWHWSEGPPLVCSGDVCAPSVPGSSASATITAFRVVPEPGACGLTLVGGVAGLVVWRMRRR